MKRLSLYLFLIFFTLPTPSQANDIRDFQIEGMSVGDSLLDYYSIESQKEMSQAYDKKTKLTSIIISDSAFRTYNQIQVTHTGSLQKILAIEGLMHMPDNYEACLFRKRSVIVEVERMFYNKDQIEMYAQDEKKHLIDKSGKSKFQSTHLNFKTGGSFRFTCYDWSKELTDKKGWIDSLSVSINSEKTTLKKLVKKNSEPIPLLEDNKLKFQDEKYYALLIGNNDYKYWSKLDSPVNDVVEIGKILKNKYGYKVDVVKNANSNLLKNKLIELSKKVTKDDNLLIYYSGHGDRNLLMSPIRAYWIPTDAAQKFDANWINTQDVSAMISQISAKHILIMVDSCYAGFSIKGTPSFTGKWDKNKKNYDDFVMKKLLNRPTRLAITSGSLEPVADTYIKNHSVFAYKFINILKQNENYISSMDLYSELNNFIISASSQRPTFNALYDMGHLDGQFFFIVKN